MGLDAMTKSCLFRWLVKANCFVKLNPLFQKITCARMLSVPARTPSVRWSAVSPSASASWLAPVNTLPCVGRTAKHTGTYVC